MWHDYPFSQRNMTTEKTVGVGVGGSREVGKKKGGRQKKGRDFHKIRGFAPLCHLLKETLKMPHPPL